MPMTVRHDGAKSKKLNATCFTRDEGGPLGAGLQDLASNHLKLQRLKVDVVSVQEKVKRDFIRYELRRRAKANRPMKRRKRRNVIKTRVESLLWDESGGNLFIDQTVAGVKAA
jgi:hypothetical protein